MVLPIIEPICAGIAVSLINKYILNNLDCLGKFLFGCHETGVYPGDTMDDSQTKDSEDESTDHEAVSSESTTIINDVQVHCHH